MNMNNKAELETNMDQSEENQFWALKELNKESSVTWLKIIP